MAYEHLAFERISDSTQRDLFDRANMLMGDVYSMFYLPFDDERRNGGAGQHSIALVLLSVLDGLAQSVYPTRSVTPDDEQRYKKLVRDKLPWGPASDGWIEIGVAAKVLYVEFRNALVHRMGVDQESRARPQGFGEPVVGKWGRIPPKFHDIATIDNIIEWPSDWPVLYEDLDRETGPAMKLSAAGFYWATKRLCDKFILELI